MSLEDSADGNSNDGDFPSSLVSMNFNHLFKCISYFRYSKRMKMKPGIDLIKVLDRKEKANLYVTQLIQIMYTIEQLVVLQPADTYDDDKYKLIQGNDFIFLYV